jgi:DNA-binding SARP family transcriptional activator
MVANSNGAAVEIRMLPAFEVFRGGRSLNLPARGQRLIALLAISGRPVARLTVAERLWPDVIDARACASLRATLWGLSRAPWSPVVVDNDALMLDCTTESDFESARALAMSVIDGSYIPVDAVCGQRLSEDLLPGWSDEWLVDERERYRQLRLHALDKICLLHAHAGRFALAIVAGLASVSSDPTRESAHRALMNAHLLEGNPSEAIRQYHIYMHLARAELGIGASPQLQELFLDALHGSSNGANLPCMPRSVHIQAV